jgi:hypothetical protein
MTRPASALPQRSPSAGSRCRGRFGTALAGFLLASSTPVDRLQCALLCLRQACRAGPRNMAFPSPTTAGNDSYSTATVPAPSRQRSRSRPRRARRADRQHDLLAGDVGVSSLPAKGRSSDEHPTRHRERLPIDLPDSRMRRSRESGSVRSVDACRRRTWSHRSLVRCIVRGRGTRSRFAIGASARALAHPSAVGR